MLWSVFSWCIYFWTTTLQMFWDTRKLLAILQVLPQPSWGPGKWVCVRTFVFCRKSASLQKLPWNDAIILGLDWKFESWKVVALWSIFCDTYVYAFLSSLFTLIKVTAKFVNECDLMLCIIQYNIDTLSVSCWKCLAVALLRHWGSRTAK